MQIVHFGCLPQVAPRRAGGAKAYCPAYDTWLAEFNPVDPSQCSPPETRLKYGTDSIQEWRSQMKAIVDLFSTDYGLFSISGILFMIGMAIWFYRFFNRKMDEADQAQRLKG